MICAASEKGETGVSSPTIAVELYGVVRDLVKESRVEVDLPDGSEATFRDLLESMAQRFGPAFRERLFGREGLLSFVKIYAGGRMISDLDETLPSGDAAGVRIIVFAAAGGG
jgi:molybdopterin converting factor small subunit